MTQLIYGGNTGNESIANSLKSLGESMFGNQAQQGVYRETARSKQRENDAAQPFADAARSGDRNALAYYGALGGKTGRDTADFNLLSRTNHATGIDDPAVSLSQLGAHEPIASTAVGQGRVIAGENARNAATNAQSGANVAEVSRRGNEQQQWTDQHSLVNLRGPDGRITMVPKSQVSNLQAHGYDVMPTLDQQKASVVGQYIQPTGAPPAQAAQPASTGTQAPAQQTAQPASTGPQVPAPSAPQPNMGNMPNDVRAMVGLPHETAEEIRAHDLDERARNSVPELAPRPTEFPQAARDAEAGGGIVAAAKNMYGHSINSIMGRDPVPELHAGLNNLSNLAARTRALPISGVSRDSVQREKWNNDNIPQPNTIFGTVPGGGEAARNKTMALITRLHAQYDSTAALARDPSTPSPEREKLIAELHELKSVLGEWEKPAAGPQGAQPAAPSATAPSASGPRKRNPKTGQVVEWNGQRWQPVQ